MAMSAEHRSKFAALYLRKKILEWDDKSNSNQQTYYLNSHPQ